MPFNITIDHATSTHGSAQSSLSDEEEQFYSSGTGVKVPTPSITSSQEYEDQEWVHAVYPDELNPSDSASRPRTSHQHRPNEATSGGVGRSGSRRHSSRDHDRERRRHPPPTSPESVDSSEEFEVPYAGGGPAERGRYYQRAVATGPPYAYAPSSSSGHSYNAYLPPANQLVQVGGPPPFPYSHPYPAPAPPPAHHHQPPGYMGPGHPAGMPVVHQVSSHGGSPYGGAPYGNEMMGYPPNGGYFPYPQSYQIPQGMMPPPFYHQPYQRIHSPVIIGTPPPQPAPATPAPAPAPAPPAAPAEKDPGIARLEHLEQLLMDQKLTQERREDALARAAQERVDMEIRARQDKEIAENAARHAAAEAKAAAEMKAAEDVKKAKEQAAVDIKKAKEEAAAKAADDAKAEAEAKAAEELAKAKEEAEKHAKEAAEAAEAAMKKAVAAASAKPPEEKRKPIKFKDAIGRKFSFPFHLCCTWEGMEELIRQAFLHVEVIGPHVADGHYDLIGPNGEIILPQVWETMVEPDWTITMLMWPMSEPPKDPDPPPPDDLFPLPPHLMGLGLEPRKAGDRGAPPIIIKDGGPPPPPPAPAAPRSGPSVVIIDPNHPGKRSRPQQGSKLAAWMAGGRAKSNKPLKAERKPDEAVQHDIVCRVM